MNKFEEKVKQIMEGCAGSMGAGMQKALFSNSNGFAAKEVKKECDKCGFLIPKYVGRYPNFCPMCGDPVNDQDKEVVGEE